MFDYTIFHGNCYCNTNLSMLHTPFPNDSHGKVWTYPCTIPSLWLHMRIRHETSDSARFQSRYSLISHYDCAKISRHRNWIQEMVIFSISCHHIISYDNFFLSVSFELPQIFSAVINRLAEVMDTPWWRDGGWSWESSLHWSDRCISHPQLLSDPNWLEQTQFIWVIISPISSAI